MEEESISLDRNRNSACASSSENNRTRFRSITTGSWAIRKMLTTIWSSTWSRLKSSAAFTESIWKGQASCRLSEA